MNGSTIQKLKVILTAQDKTGKVFKETGRNLSNLASQAKMASAAIGGLAVGICVKAIRSAAAFESKMTNVATIIDTNT